MLGSSQSSLSVGWPQDDDCLRRARAGIMKLVKEGLDPNSAHSISINKELHRLNGTVSSPDAEFRKSSRLFTDANHQH